MPVKHLLLIALFTATAACSSKGQKVDENLSEVQLYQQAQSDLDNKSYTRAIEKLRAMESRYPFGRYADQSQLELIYAYYQNGEAEASRAAADRFIRLHPQHPNVDYAYYLKGLASFEQDRGFLSRFLPLDMTKRDPGAARDSFNEFAQLTSRFPNSQYAPDAKARMIYLRNLLAANEIHLGQYYLRRHAYVAAANRGSYVVENFQGTPYVDDGLALMADAYRHLGLTKPEEDAIATLKLNEPKHPNFDKDGMFVSSVTEPDGRTWISQATLGLIEGKAPAPDESRANRDLQRQYDIALQELPPEVIEGLVPVKESKKRSIWSRISFGLFD